MMLAKENALKTIPALESRFIYQLTSFNKKDLAIVDIKYDINNRKVQHITFLFNTVKQAQPK